MRWLIGIGGIVVVVVLVLGMFGDRIGFFVAGLMLTPDHDFDAATAAPAPDYALDASWAGLPGIEDASDRAPEGLAIAGADAEVAVFYIYPTTYYTADGWNAPIDEPESRRIIEDFILEGQAGAFNGCCAVYTPLYRQATLAAFFEENSNTAAALELAYSDVERAFDAFLQRIGADRPFILAGHSQGARHLHQLLKARITGTPLLERMVTAWPVGFYFDADELAADLPDVPLCSSAVQTGCLITWNAVGPAFEPFEPTDGYVCVNPLNWAADDSAAGHDANPGSFSDGALIPGAADARCLGGMLRVSELRTEAYDDLPMNMGTDNFHVLDYALFYMSVRENAQQRVDAWLAAQRSDSRGVRWQVVEPTPDAG